MSQWVALTREDVLAIHELIVSAPVRDLGALDSAVEKPWTGYMGIEVYPGLAEKAAALLSGLSRNHPFLDGNKRTAVGALDAFLQINGQELRVSDDEEVARFVEEVAQGNVQHEFVTAWITAHLVPLP